jgi:4-hydroxy-tetrahydrodipicolinate synthase
MPGCDLIRGVVEIWRALQRNDNERVYRVYFPLCGIVTMEVSSLDGFLTIEKYLLEKQGIFKNRLVRRPFAFELDPQTAAEVDRLYDYFLKALD